MAKVLRCRHIGPDKHCLFEAHGETEDEILTQVAAHAKDVHGIEEVTEEIVQAALAKITEA
jgi:predicted small metal-binding protein